MDWDPLAISIGIATLIFVITTARHSWLSVRRGWWRRLEADDFSNIEPLDETHARMTVHLDPERVGEVAAWARGEHGPAATPGTTTTPAALVRGPSDLQRTIGRAVVSGALALGALYILVLADDPSSAAENWASGGARGDQRLLDPRLGPCEMTARWRAPITDPEEEEEVHRFVGLVVTVGRRAPGAPHPSTA